MLFVKKQILTKKCICLELNRFDRDFADHFNNGTFESTNSYETEEQLTPAEKELWNKMADQCVSNPETR